MVTSDRHDLGDEREDTGAYGNANAVEHQPRQAQHTAQAVTSPEGLPVKFISAA